MTRTLICGLMDSECSTPAACEGGCLKERQMIGWRPYKEWVDEANSITRADLNEWERKQGDKLPSRERAEELARKFRYLSDPDSRDIGIILDAYFRSRLVDMGVIGRSFLSAHVNPKAPKPEPNSTCSTGLFPAPRENWMPKK